MKGSYSHLAGNPSHGDGDVIFGCRVQVFPGDGDHGASGCWALRRADLERLGVLDRDGQSCHLKSAVERVTDGEEEEQGEKRCERCSC